MPSGSLRPILRHAVRSAALLFSIAYGTVHAGQQRDSLAAFQLENSHIRCTVTLNGSQLISDRLEVLRAADGSKIRGQIAVETDADFGLDLMYTSWDAPGKANNADNVVMLTKEHFSHVSTDQHPSVSGPQQLQLLFKGIENPIRLLVTYQLLPDAYYVKRKIAVLDTTFGHHFLRWFWPRRGTVTGISEVTKPGGFGQPAAALTGRGCAFFGLEYPASENLLQPAPHGKYQLQCGEEYGKRIGNEWLESDWIVEAICPDPYVKNWFAAYLNDIRVAPLRPYTLYNSWYDLRSPEYPRVPPENFMSEQSALKMVDLLRRNMMTKHNITLDAFVLDDGWDVYQSDWVLRQAQWPNGLRPLADELKKTNTSLGIWFGPTGGYSFRNQRINWMKNHGYELVGDQLCVGGTNYGALLTKRVTDFARNEGVDYFKWDGVQFSCSEPNHSHPIDVYSRRAILDRVDAMCRSVREKNPQMFLNITSGTWMSPWWLKFANTIWMQGGDYGYADVPSISKRDASSTYRDFVLYDGLREKDLWFPIANLMTHGIIKGKIHSVGSPDEPLDKFTDDALLYFARGVSMHELYISPDLLSDGEWQSLSEGLAWARDRFPVLMRTEMVGGNPMKGETYGYVHFVGPRGIIAARNPVIEASSLKVELTQAYGLDPGVSSLVLERVYPTRWISPRLYRTGDKITIPLEGFETGVYELYPLSTATEPLLAGMIFDKTTGPDGAYSARVHSMSSDATILNSSLLTTPSEDLKKIRETRRQLLAHKESEPVSVSLLRNVPNGIELDIAVAASTDQGACAVLFVPESTITKPQPLVVTATVDGISKPVKTEHQEGRAQWFTVAVEPGQHVVIFSANGIKQPASWEGVAHCWFIAMQKRPSATLSFSPNRPSGARILPPHPWTPGETRVSSKLGEIDFSVIPPR
jgi:hypothetical protein